MSILILEEVMKMDLGKIDLDKGLNIIFMLRARQAKKHGNPNNIDAAILKRRENDGITSEKEARQGR